MKTIFENGLIMRREKEHFLSYIFEDSTLFSPTGFKVIQAGGERALLGCVKVTWNGKIKLIYSGANYRRLDQVIHMLSAELFLRVAVNLIEAVLHLKENSFTKCTNLDLSLDRIFIDWGTGEIALVYLPLSDKANMGAESGFDNDLRSRLVRWIERYYPYDTGALAAFSGKLCDYNYTLKDISAFYRKHAEVQRMECSDGINEHTGEQQISGYRTMSEAEETSDEGMAAAPAEPTVLSLRLTLVSGNGPSELNFYGNEYVIGRSLAKTNGCIQGNPRVSSVHCRIIRDGQEYFVVDMNSFNGTYLNEMRIAANTRHALRQGDTIRLADVSYAVSIGGR